MKSTKIIFVMLAWLGLQSLSGLIAQEKQQIDTTSLMSVENNRDSFWQRGLDGRSIFFNDGSVGIGTAVPSYRLHVAGDMRVSALNINGQYTLPTSPGAINQFLRGDGTWAVPAGGGGGGDCHWQSGFGNGIYYNQGNVGIGTSAANANAKLQVIGNLNVGNNPHTGSLIGENAFVGGLNSIASGNYSFSFGREAKATHMNAVAIGFKAEATSEMAVAIGYRVYSNAESTYLFGERIIAGSSGAFVIGRGESNASMLQNNVINSLMVGFNSNVPTLFIGPSNVAGTTGSIGIGNMIDPQAKLHIKADATETATIRLEPTATSGTYRFAQIYLGTHSISAANTANMVFKTPATSRHFVFENGNVGIGVTNPSKKLVVAGDIDFSGNLYSSGQLFTGSNWMVNAGGSIYRLDGNVGIGVNNPQRRLVVAGDIEFTGDLYTNGQIFEGGSNWTENAGNIYRLDGKVGIGIINSFDHLLAVNGSILATEVVIRHPSNWYDHVFEDGYKLMSLDQLEEFVSKNKHLPDIPTEKDVMAEGFQLGELSALLLKKIEELTLYTIQQQKLIEKQQELLERLMEND